MTLLLVAAEPREFHGLLRRSRRIQRLDWPVGWARAAECGGRRLLLMANGAGAERAARAAAVALARVPADAVVSAGYCGALDPALEPGSVYVATSVIAGGCRFPALNPGSVRPHASGAVASVGRVARTSAEKARLRAESGAGGVEMEAAGVARAASEAGLPFYCVRAVTDLANESFAIDFDALLRRDGHFDTMLLLRAIVRKPVPSLPEVVRLWRRCRVAARNLGEFIADCRF